MSQHSLTIAIIHITITHPYPQTQTLRPRAEPLVAVRALSNSSVYFVTFVNFNCPFELIRSLYWKGPSYYPSRPCSQFAVPQQAHNTPFRHHLWHLSHSHPLIFYRSQILSHFVMSGQFSSFNDDSSSFTSLALFPRQWRQHPRCYRLLCTFSPASHCHIKILSCFRLSLARIC